MKRTLDDYFHVKVETRDGSLKGWNWGKAQVLGGCQIPPRADDPGVGNEIAFSVQGRPTFELPLSTVANSNIAGKNEVALEFNPIPPPPSDTKNPLARAPDELIEMRFYVPGKSMKSRESDAGSDEAETDLDEDGNEISAAEAMHNIIKERADIGAVIGDSIVVFEDVLILTPR